MPQHEGSFELAIRSASVTDAEIEHVPEASQSANDSIDNMESEEELNDGERYSHKNDKKLRQRTLRKLDFILLPFLSRK